MYSYYSEYLETPDCIQHLSLSELREMASRQQQQIDEHQQQLVAKEQRVRYLRQQENHQQTINGEAERLRKLRERVEAQELKLRKLRTIRGEVEQQRSVNTTLVMDLEKIRTLFNEKEKELSLAVAKVDELNRQLDEIRKNNVMSRYLNSGNGNYSELEKLRNELMYRSRLNQQQQLQIISQRKQIDQKKAEMSEVDQRITELQARLQRKRTHSQQHNKQLQQHYLSPQLSNEISTTKRQTLLSESIGNEISRKIMNSVSNSPTVQKHTSSIGYFSSQIEMRKNNEVTHKTNNNNTQPSVHFTHKSLGLHSQHDCVNDHTSTESNSSHFSDAKNQSKYRTLPHNTKFGRKNAEFIPVHAVSAITTLPIRNNFPQSFDMCNTNTENFLQSTITSKQRQKNSFEVKNEIDIPYSKQTAPLLPPKQSTAISTCITNVSSQNSRLSSLIAADNLTSEQENYSDELDSNFRLADAPPCILSILRQQNNSEHDQLINSKFDETPLTSGILDTARVEDLGTSCVTMEISSSTQDSPNSTDYLTTSLSSNNDLTSSSASINKCSSLSKSQINSQSKQNVCKIIRRVSFDPLALLLDACLEGEIDLVKKTSLEVKNISACNDEGVTALHNAICAGHLHIVEYLVQFGCDVNAQDSDGWTPLHCAASCNNLQIVRYLVEHGACIFATTLSDQETPVEKCEEDEDGFQGCFQYLYNIQEKLGIMNQGCVYSLYNYTAERDDELSLHEGQKLCVLRKGDEVERDWWWACDVTTKHLHSELTSNTERLTTENSVKGYIPRNLLGLHPRISKFNFNSV